MTAILFIAGWILLGLAFFFIAIRGGPRGARESLYGQSRRANRWAVLLMLVLYVAFGVAVPTLVLAGNKDADEIASEDIKLTASEKRGRLLFGEYCNQCHTLAAAQTVGRVGPNFNELRPNYALVADAVTKGRMRGNGTMPAGLVTGGDVRDVACFVDAATHPGQQPGKQCRVASKPSGSGEGGRGGESQGGSPEN